MPKRSKQVEVVEVERGALAAAIMDHPREFVGIIMATAATVAIFVNALFLQRGPHPAPIFATRPVVVHAPAIAARPHAVTPQDTSGLTAQKRAQIVIDIQRELSRRGFYDGAVDGIWGAQTDTAVREFARAAGLRANLEASDDLLRAIAMSPVRRAAPQPTPRTDAIAQLLAPSKRVLAVQSALADFGYGQLKPTGVIDPGTRAAIEKFERDHKMPITGQLSERVVRALAAMTGRPLE